MAAFMVALKRRKTGGYAVPQRDPKDVRKGLRSSLRMGWEEKLNIAAGHASP